MYIHDLPAVCTFGFFYDQCRKDQGWDEYNSRACTHCKLRVKEAEEIARKEAEEESRREAEEIARREEKERAWKEAERRAWKEAEWRAWKEAEERARKDAEERARKEGAEALREIEPLRKAKEEAEANVLKMEEEVKEQLQEANAKESAMMADVAEMQEKLTIGCDVSSLVLTAVEAVAPQYAGALIPLKDFMLQEEIEILKFVEVHANKTEDAAVCAAIALCAEFVSSESAVHNASTVLEELMKSGVEEALNEAKEARNTATSAHWKAARKLKEACAVSVRQNIESLRNKHLESLQRAREVLSSLSETARAVGGKSMLTTSVQEGETGSHSAVESAKNCVAEHNEWLLRNSQGYSAVVEKVRDAMRELSGGLRECCAVLEAPSSSCTLPSTLVLMEGLRSRMEERAAFLGSLIGDFTSLGARICECAGYVVSDLMRESLLLDEVVACAERAEKVFARGEAADQEVLQKMGAVQVSLFDAEDEYEEAESKLNRVQRRNAGGEGTALQRVKVAKQELRRLHKQQSDVWKEAYDLASCGFPELPSLVLEQCTISTATDTSPASFLSLCDPKAWGLLAPQRRKGMYEELVQISSVKRGESRHDVWRATIEDVEVCLKEFDLGSITQDLSESANTFQHELMSVARLSHPHVVPVSLFFLEWDGHNLLAFVQYPYYPCGSLDKWLASMGDSGRAGSQTSIRLVLHDVLRGLEHVHYHNITHCDVKAPNVLIEERDGQHRGVLCDFDLSHDEKARKNQTASFASASVAFGAKGTVGALSMAPEVFAGQLPDARADMFSFGGMALGTLYPTHAKEWEVAVMKWGDDGVPCLSDVGSDSAAKLLIRLMQREPSKRLTSHECVADSFFVADLRALALVAELERDHKELQFAHAEHARLVAYESAKLAKEKLKLASVADAVRKEAEQQRIKFDNEMAELEMQVDEAKRTGVRNRETEAKISAEREKIQAQRVKHDKEIQAQNAKLAKEKERAEREGRAVEVRIIAEKKALDARSRDLAKKETDVTSNEMKFKVPPWWSQPGGFQMPKSDYFKDALQNFIRESGCGCSPTTSKIKVVNVLRIENESLWKFYQTRRDILIKALSKHSDAVKGKLAAVTPKQPDVGSLEDLSSDVNEHYLFHGTSNRVARIVAEYGFDERLADMGGLYGAGTYFASNACKAEHYAKLKQDLPDSYVILVCRVCMGWPYKTQTQHRQQRIPPDNAATPGRPFDSIFAEKKVANKGVQLHNEYVVFDRAQAYPEYLVQFKLS